MLHHTVTSGISIFVYDHTNYLPGIYWQGTPEVLKKDQFGLHDAGSLEHILHEEIFSRCHHKPVARP
jgi:hypothetical protein